VGALGGVEVVVGQEVEAAAAVVES
jgi:hypothetical protein